MPSAIEVRKVPIHSVADASELAKLIDEGVFEADRIIAIIGKTEGNGGVNDYTRIIADRAFREVIQAKGTRSSQDVGHLRLDIAGYGERRRQALAIYANQLIDRLLEDGGEVTLEPMSAGDRKVIHDAAGERTGVRSYSEGESPQRYVVLANDASDEEE